MKTIQPRPFHPWKTLFVLSILIALFVYHYFFRDVPDQEVVDRDLPDPAQLHWTGRTMGTHYVIRIADSPLVPEEADEVHAELKAVMEFLNNQMSVYLPDSEISRFNRHESTEPYRVSRDFAHVTRHAVELAEQTDGAFDPTIGPLMALWGFGPDRRLERIPDDEEIEQALPSIGYAHISVPAVNRIQKRIPEVTLDLNAVAKGYAVDLIGRILNRHGLTNHYVEIGGDLVVSGHNHEGNPWRIGIEQPDPDAPPGTALVGIAHVSGVALAGSGDYRNFYDGPDGERVSHILDPRTGRPVRHPLGGVTVVAPTCLEADGVATAAFVMGLEDGLRWINELPNIEALFIYRREDGTFGYRLSHRFRLMTSFEPLEVSDHVE